MLHLAREGAGWPWRSFGSPVGVVILPLLVGASASSVFLAAFSFPMGGLAYRELLYHLLLFGLLLLGRDRFDRPRRSPTGPM